MALGDPTEVSRPENADLARRLDRIAELLTAQHANPFRVNAYRRAASTLRDLPDAAVDVYSKRGIEGLEALPGIGKSLASLIREYSGSGRISLLERLEGAVSAEEVLATVPGLGPALARRIHERLGVETLEELECACHDGRLAALPGFGPRRVAALSASVAAALGRPGRTAAGGARAGAARIPVSTLLEIDAEYRLRASQGELPRIAPRRFNPRRVAWLPVLHRDWEGWHLTALYSNSARAHELEKTKDWVVIYAERDGQHEQWTVVSEGPVAERRRVVRGREVECSKLALRSSKADAKS